MKPVVTLITSYTRLFNIQWLLFTNMTTDTTNKGIFMGIVCFLSLIVLWRSPKAKTFARSACFVFLGIYCLNCFNAPTIAKRRKCSVMPVKSSTIRSTKSSFSRVSSCSELNKLIQSESKSLSLSTAALL